MLLKIHLNKYKKKKRKEKGIILIDTKKVKS